jgi:hypothetical protein
MNRKKNLQAVGFYNQLNFRAVGTFRQAVRFFQEPLLELLLKFKGRIGGIFCFSGRQPWKEHHALHNC